MKKVIKRDELYIELTPEERSNLKAAFEAIKMGGMNVFAEKGDKIICRHTIAGYDRDKELGRKYLKLGEVYTVEDAVAFDSTSYVWLKEIPNIKFSTIHFADLII